MNEKQESRENTERKPFEWWKQFEGRAVVIQLRPGHEYIGVTYPNEPLLMVHPQTGETVPRCIPFIKGELKMQGEGPDFRLALLTGDPDPAKQNVRFQVVLHPDDTLYVTVLEKGNIQA